MAQVSINVAATAEKVWEVLADASSYGDWVVGTKEIVHADEGWPEVGKQLQYRLGIGPISVGDRTTVVEAVPPHLLVLRADLHRFGAASIRIELEQRQDGTTHVSMDEVPIEGVVDTAHNPISDAALVQRNKLALDRLRRLAESRA